MLVLNVNVLTPILVCAFAVFFLSFNILHYTFLFGIALLAFLHRVDPKWGYFCYGG